MFLLNFPVLFIFSSPQEWILVIAAVALLFGANKLPELAKSIGKTRNAFKEGMREADEEEFSSQTKTAVSPEIRPAIAEVDDETLLNEMKRRQANQLNS